VIAHSWKTRIFSQNERVGDFVQEALHFPAIPLFCFAGSYSCKTETPTEQRLSGEGIWKKPQHSP